MLKLLVGFFLFFTPSLYAKAQLQSNYFVDSKSIKVSDILLDSSDKRVLYTISKERHSKRVKSKELLKKLQTLGYKNTKSQHSYTQFTQKSPINVSLMALKLKEHYTQMYKDLSIKSINVYPRSYINALPKKYEVFIDKRSHLKNRGTLYIKTLQNKKIFFNYTIEAEVKVYTARENISKEEELAITNLKKKSIILDKFRAMPLQNIQKGTLQARHRIKKGSVITLRDISTLVLVRRNSSINVVVNDAGVSISFVARAQQNGRYGETITITNSNGKRLKAVVTGLNRAEIR